MFLNLTLKLLNSFLNKKGSPTILPTEVIRSTTIEKDRQIDNLHAFWKRNEEVAPVKIAALKKAAIAGENLFESLMEAVKYCSLGQICRIRTKIRGN